MSFCEFTHSIFLNPEFKSQEIIIFSTLDGFFRIHFFSQIKISHYASSQNDLHYRNGRNYGGMGFFIVVGGVGCMLAPSLQLNKVLE